MIPSWRLRRRGLRPAAIALAVASCFAMPVVLANPTGASVAAGQVSFHQQGNLLQITNSPNAIINWQSFSIGANEVTRFVQGSASSAVLNRVVGHDPSSILGALQSNGRIFLLNPNGIVFGASARIDVAGLVASSLHLSDADFLGGKLRFVDAVGAGAVVNEGAIATPSGGQVYLVGASVENRGLIRSPRGEVVLAAGKRVELVDPGTPDLRVEITAPDNRAVNLGAIAAEAGRVGIYAGLLSQGGVIDANSAQATEDGRIVLKATQGVTLAAGSLTAASGRNGGTVTVESGDTTLVAGTIEAKGSEGQGGRVEVLGNKVGLIGGAQIDVSGESGGGMVLVGGDFQGKNPDIQNAYRTYVGADATITADALTSGDGGRVIVWSDDTTRFYGNISARGGAQGGDGGFVEVSGKGNLGFDGRVNVGASAGSSGTLLLDPQNISIQNFGVVPGPDDGDLNADTPTVSDPAGAVYFADGIASNFSLSDSALEAQTGNVVLQATQDITVAGGLSGGGLDFVNQTAGERVVFQAGRDIAVFSPITTAGGNIHLEADSPHSPAGGGDGTGQLRINAAISTRGTLGTGTDGSITLIGGGVPVNGGFTIAANVLAGTGGIQISLSAAGTLNLGLGAPGATQLSSSDIARLQSTGALVIGRATSGGDDGLGLNAQLLTVNSISNNTAGAIPLSAPSGTSFELIAGAGGITLERPIVAHQDVVITTPGTVTVNDTIDTTIGNNDITINAGNLVLGPSGMINVGAGSCSLNGGACFGSSGSGGGSSGLPPELEPGSTQPENVLVGATDQAVTPPASVSSGTKDSEEEDPSVKKKPVCTGGGKGQAAASAAVGGSFSRQCTSRGCF
jgi:filamentous hemagglutinin family protein